MNVIKVSGASPVPQLSGCIVKSVRDSLEQKGKVELELRAVGASAVNQMVKAVASARGILATKGLDILMCPGFDEIEEEGQIKTIITAKIKVM